MLTEIPQTRYVIKVNGMILTAPQPTRQLAEAMLLSFSPETRALAEIVAINVDGKELLLG